MILRPADLDRDELLFYWLRNEEQAIRYSDRVGPISKEAHHSWWLLTRDDRYVAEIGGRAVGVLRISPFLKGNGLVSIIVAPSERGKGYGTEMLTLVTDLARGYDRLVGEIKPENVASQRAFLNAGWVPTRMEWGRK